MKKKLKIPDISLTVPLNNISSLSISEIIIKIMKVYPFIFSYCTV